MAKENKVGNLLKFSEYDKLQSKQKPTKRTEVGGFAVLENITVDKEGQIADIKKNIEQCGKKKIKKIHQMITKSLEKRAKKEKGDTPSAE